MTDSQRGIWAVAQTGPQGAAAYNECLSLRMSGPLDLPALQGALQKIVDRHEALRATCSPDGDFLRIAPDLKIEIPITDLSGVGERESAARSLLETESLQPFDLSLGPLLRSRLLRMAATDHILLLVVHHVITDGRSFEVLLREIEKVYAAERRGQVCELPPAGSFQDYARRLNEISEGPDMAAAERYWLARFDPPPPPLALPTDRPRPVIQTYRGGREKLKLDTDLVAGIRALSTQQRCTLFMVLLSAFEVLLHHVTGESDLVIGVHSAHQALVSEQTFVGLGINTLPMRSRIAAGQTFAETLEISKQDLLQSFAHDCYHFSRLMRKLRMVRDPSRPPLISAVFNLDGDASLLRFDDLDVTVTLNPVPLARFDLFWNLAVGESGIEAECVYNADLFDAVRVRGWLALFERVLSLVAADPEIRIRAVEEELVEMKRQGQDLEGGRLRKISGLKMKVARRQPVSLESSTANEI